MKLLTLPECCFIILLVLAGTMANAQSITGDTIYVNSKVEVAISFPVMPNSFYTNPVDAPYSIKTLGTGFTIIAKSKNTEPASLSVTEGKRSHLFYLVYKKNINIYNINETFLDYSTVKKLEEHIKQKAASREFNNRYTALAASAKNNYDQKKYNEAKSDYEQILKMKSDDKNAVSQLKKINKILNTANKSKGKQKTNDNPAKTSNEEGLKTKYPEINFEIPPPEQQFDEADLAIGKNKNTLIEVLAERPRLDIDDDSHKIKIICQGLSFKNKAVYIKLLIRNKSKDDFLTGAAVLTWEKKSGKPVNLFPLYLYPETLPIIKAGNEATIIYVARPANIADKDVLHFKLNDRLNKIKLDIKIKGSVYTEESIRLL